MFNSWIVRHLTEADYAVKSPSLTLLFSKFTLPKFNSEIYYMSLLMGFFYLPFSAICCAIPVICYMCVIS